MSRTLQTLSSRLTLTDGQSLIDKDIYVPASFVFDTAYCAIYISGHGVTLKNVRLFTYATEFLDEWMDDPVTPASGTGLPWDMVGIRAAATKGLTLENVHIQGFPQAAFLGYRVEDSSFKRVSATQCFAGYTFSWNSGGNHRIRFDGCDVYDTWGPGPDVWPSIGGAESVIRPGYFSGGDGLTGYFDDFSFDHLHFHGELYGGLKLVRSKRGTVQNLRTHEMFLQGTQGRDENADLTTDGSESVIFRQFDIDKDYGAGLLTDDGNAIQVSWNATDCSFLDFTLQGGEHNGHGIQVSGDCDIDIRDGVMGGFNQLVGGSPAYALHVTDGSTVNADVLTVNDFTDQLRLVLTD